ncbi:hypothetical protein BHE90_017381 [Fusarium euwallaceae]|uniref:Uncharacterized protein n=1 Tax=Fusarium euwallaceae TaxID=1147111 RepID=A0A430KY12_9HYPO|nr:hypothetical protein BHE90_017381 [Fusarium euwallaceae]
MIGAVINYMLGNDIEHATSAFWQVFLQSQFRLEEGWSAICEQPSDGGRDAVDVIPYAYNLNYPHSLFKASVNEFKRPSHPPDKLIEQTRRYARRAVTKSQARYILASSMRGPEFMLWVFSRHNDTLEPFFPQLPRFISILEPEGVLFYQYISAHKDPDPDSLDSYRQIPESMWALAVGTQPFPSSSNQPGPGVAQPLSSTLPEEHDETVPGVQVGEDEFGQADEGDLDEGEEGEEGEAILPVSVHATERSGIKVRIHRETHVIRSDKYWFTNQRRERVDTTRDEWKKYDRKYYRYKPDTRYWSETRPDN